MKEEPFLVLYASVEILEMTLPKQSKQASLLKQTEAKIIEQSSSL